MAYGVVNTMYNFGWPSILYTGSEISLLQAVWKYLEISENPDYTTWRRDFVMEQPGGPWLIISYWLVKNITPPCSIEGNINRF